MRFVFETGKLELDSQDLLTGAAFLINLVSEVINSVDLTIDLERANEAPVDDDRAAPFRSWSMRTPRM